jgi:hypothetical protein
MGYGAWGMGHGAWGLKASAKQDIGPKSIGKTGHRALICLLTYSFCPSITSVTKSVAELPSTFGYIFRVNDSTK